MPRRSPYAIVLSAPERRKLEQIAAKYTLPYYIVARAKVVLFAADGLDNKTIGEQLSIPRRERCQNVGRDLMRPSEVRSRQGCRTGRL